jgi:Putative 2OG-Fe(II) oxygenase
MADPAQAGNIAPELRGRRDQLFSGGIAAFNRDEQPRDGDPARAEAELLPLISTPSAMIYWPYLSLCWRLLGDDRAVWLDRPDELFQPLETGLSAAELARLAEVLRPLHTAAQPYLEQSVRGGTQTDRSVLLRREPELQQLKARLLELVRDYIERLPPPDPQHPLLGAPRQGPLLIEGSWSVRLSSQGYNVPHTHALGWLSSAFYVALPSEAALGTAPAGHIAFGQAPSELGLTLEPYRTIAPAPGRLVLFPSTMWHGTVPFDRGERLVIAFDIRRPL